VVLSSDQEQELGEEAWRELARQVPPTVTVYPALVLFCAIATPYAKEHPRALALGLLLLAGAGLSRLLLARKILSGRTDVTWGMQLTTLAVALLWGLFNASAVYFYGYSWTSQLTMVVTVGMTAGATTTLSTHLRLFRAYAALMVVPGALQLSVSGGQESFSALPMWVFLAFIMATARLQSQRYWKAARSEKLLQQRTIELEKASQAKSDFLATMSHEIRTPMNAIFGMTELLINTELNPTQQEWLGTLRGGCENLLSLLSEILDLSKIEAGSLELEERPYDLLDCLENTITLFRTLALEKGLQFECDWSELSAPFWIQGDATRLRQVISNLLSNALKFTSQGQILVTVRRLEGDLEMAILDSGDGIPADKMELLFRPFSQLDASTTRRYGGSGLGLAICEKLASLMKARIWVESGGNIGGQAPPTYRCNSRTSGSCFYFRWPYQPVAGPTPLAQSRQVDVNSELKILLVEDNSVNRRVLAALLEKLGHQAELASDGLEACSMCAQHRFDLIFMDLQMPNRDGLTATREIRLQSIEPQPYIVALTANALVEDRQRCLEAGMNDYLSKPIRSEELRRVLQECRRGARS
jgi:signal transduction histidine kinase/ActR/RegA family two-component response regulator